MDKENKYEPADMQSEKRMSSYISAIPKFAKIFYLIAAVSALLFLAYIISEPFANFYNRYIGSVLRNLLAGITNLIPFSFAELLVLMLPLITVLVIMHASKNYCDSWKDVFIYCASILSILALAFSIFAVGFAAGYHGTRLDKKLGLSREDVSAEELYNTAVILAQEVNREAAQVGFLKRNFSVMPYTVEEMSDELVEIYNKSTDEYKFIPKLKSRIKPVMLSEAMSYTHITGIYTFFTGEANLNVAFPDYTLPFTAAHELAHQRGIAREDEANFMAFLICKRSDDPYTRYSAYLNMYEYVMSALFVADKELYREAYKLLCSEARFETLAYSQFFDKYRDSVASDVSGAINNTFLTIQGTEGTASYGMVVDLAVAYYKK